MRGEVNKLKILIALIIFFQGFSIALLSHPLIKASQWFRILGWLMMLGGVGYIYFLYKARKLEPDSEEAEVTKKENVGLEKLQSKVLMKTKIQKREIKSKKIEEPEETSLLTNFMNKLVKKSENISPYTLPIIGAIIIDAVIMYNIFLSRQLDLKGFDMITILFGVSLILYNYIPKSFEFARDFFVFFIGLLFLILVFPPIFYETLLGSTGGAQVTKVLLADPVSGILNIGGIDSYTVIEFQSGKDTAFVYFPLQANGLIAGVGIDEACSGIYTASIFLAAFITFVLIEYKRFDLKVGIIVVVGILATYFANILRMLIIILMGHYYDTDPGNLATLEWWHINAGWLIFMVWIIPFWWLMYRFLMRKDISKIEKKSMSEEKI
jgi:exosortase/archaeosortase family protein